MVHIKADDYEMDFDDRKDDEKSHCRSFQRYLLNPVGNPPKGFEKEDWILIGGPFLSAWRNALKMGRARLEAQSNSFDYRDNLLPGLPDELVVSSIMPRITENILAEDDEDLRLQATLGFRHMGGLRSLSSHWRKLVSLSLHWGVVELMRHMSLAQKPECQYCGTSCHYCLPEWKEENDWKWSQLCWRLKGMDGFTGLALDQRVSFSWWLENIVPELD